MTITRPRTDRTPTSTPAGRAWSAIGAVVALLIAAAVPMLTTGIPAAHAGVSDCTGTPENPIYPNHDSSKVLSTYDNPTAGEVLIRHGFYCVPESAKGNPAKEAAAGFGFGLDKVHNRHYIGRQEDGWHQAEAIKAVKFVLSAPGSNVTTKTDDWGFGWNFHVWARGGTDCAVPGKVETCKNQVDVPVIGASTEGGDDHEPGGGMPAGDPLGLQTVYCDYGDVTRLRCEIWVTAALIKGADGQHIN